MQYKWPKYFTPCLVLCYFFLFVVVDCCLDIKESGGWSAIGLIVGIPVIIVSFIADLVIKFLCNEKLGRIFLIETFVVAAILIFLLGRFYAF